MSEDTYTTLTDTVLSAIQKASCAGRLVVAFSGGVDSHVLLHVLVQLGKRDLIRHPLVACHINHQLQHASAKWSEHCKEVAEKLGVAIHCIDVDVDLTKGASPEEAARDARYEALQSMLEPGDGLVTAHHAGDQVETLLLQLLRGAGVDGLASMAASRSEGFLHYRPLLGIGRAQILDYARTNSLQWIEDPSNASERFSRNYLRNEVVPLLRSRWPGLEKSIARTAENCADSAALNRALAEIDSSEIVDAVGRVNLRALGMLDSARKANVLRYWIKHRTRYFPSRSSIKEILHSVIGASEDATPEYVIGEMLLKRYRQHLYLVEREANPLPEDWELVWHDTDNDLPIPELNFCLSQTLLRNAMSRSRPDGVVTVRVRRGGETLRAIGQQSKSLKNLFQEKGIPPWYRDRIPLVFCGDRLIAIAGLEEFSCDEIKFSQ
ncbi:MAG: tRNA lysidine(34) synthetase TilS [Pseudomonadota bacterium]